MGRSGLGTAECTASSEHSDIVPTGLGVVVLDGEHHHEDEEEPRGAEEVPEVVVVEDEEDALPVEVPGGAGRERGGLELSGVQFNRHLGFRLGVRDRFRDTYRDNFSTREQDV